MTQTLPSRLKGAPSTIKIPPPVLAADAIFSLRLNGPDRSIAPIAQLVEQLTLNQ